MKKIIITAKNENAGVILEKKFYESEKEKKGLKGMFKAYGYRLLMTSSEPVTLVLDITNKILQRTLKFKHIKLMLEEDILGNEGLILGVDYGVVEE